MHITWPKQFKPWKVATVDSSIVVSDTLVHWVLLHNMHDLKTAQMNMQCRLIWELTFYEFKLGHNIMETNKIICYAKDNDAIDLSTVT